MKIKLVSDLHLEFSDITINNDQNVDVLILSGDILVAEKLNSPQSDHGIRFRNFLDRVSKDFPHVVYVAGNHEFYNGKFYKTVNILKDYCDSNFDNVYFLENGTKVIDDVVFVGATLWTDMNKGDPMTLYHVSTAMNDFRLIKNDHKGYSRLKPIDVVGRHIQSMQYFKIVLEDKKDKKCVVVGHHSPSFKSCHPDYDNDTLMNGAYHSDLGEFILDHPQICLWTHGHTHHPFDYKIGETRVVCNPRGYESRNYGEQTNWDPNLVIEI